MRINASNSKEWAMRILVIGLAIFWLGLMAASWAEADSDRAPASDQSNASASGGDEDYNFSWLDPEKKIYVLQNRRYQKSGRAFATVMVGPGLSNPYRTVWNLDVRLGYYFSENWGIEGFYVNPFNSENNTIKALSGTGTSVSPVIRQFSSEAGALLHWAPWYAKLNVFNEILYFDWYFTAGVATLGSNVYVGTNSGLPGAVSQNNIAAVLGTGHLYHLTHNVDVRLDFTDEIYSAPVFGVSSPGEDQTAWYSNINISLGLSLKL